MRNLIVAAVTAMMVLAGCASDYGSSAGASSSGIGTTGLAVGAAAGALVASWVYFSDREPPLGADSLTYKTSGALETCLGSTGRESELLPDERARWVYQRESCRFTLMLDKGRVTETLFASAPAECRKTLARCLQFR